MSQTRNRVLVGLGDQLRCHLVRRLIHCFQLRVAKDGTGDAGNVRGWLQHMMSTQVMRLSVKAEKLTHKSTVQTPGLVVIGTNPGRINVYPGRNNIHHYLELEIIFLASLRGWLVLLTSTIVTKGCDIVVHV